MDKPVLAVNLVVNLIVNLVVNTLRKAEDLVKRHWVILVKALDGV